MNKKITTGLSAFFSAGLMVAAALTIGAILILISGNNPIIAYGALLEGAFGNAYRFSETLVKMIPLMIMALGVSIAYKNQLWNIGAGGQFTMGMILSTVVCLYCNLPPKATLIVSFIAGFVGGAIWGGIAGWLKARFNANEVITTLMLDYIANFFLAYLVYGPLIDPNGFNFPQSPMIDKAVRFSKIVTAGRLHSGLYVALAILIVMIFFWRSTLGFRISLAGQGKNVARYSGININRTIVITMALSGGLSGLAGWNELHGIHFRLMTDIAGSYGSIAIVIALLGSLNPIGIAIAAFFFSVLIVGGNTMQNMTAIPFSIIGIIQGLVIVFVITRTAFTFPHIRQLFKKKEGADE